MNYLLCVTETSWTNAKHCRTMEIHNRKHWKGEQLYQECLNTCLNVSKWLRFTLFSEMGTMCGSDHDHNFNYADLILLLKIQLQIWFKDNIKSSSHLWFLRHTTPGGSRNDTYSGAAVYIILSHECHVATCHTRTVSM